MTAAQLAALDRQFGLSTSGNAEIAHVWYRLAIANKYEPAYRPMERYLLTIGRRKLIVPLYRDLAATPEGKARARKIYAVARAGYHPLAQSAIDLWPPRPLSRLPAPERRKTRTMPSKDGLRLNDAGGVEQAWPEPGHPDQQGPVTAA